MSWTGLVANGAAIIAILGGAAQSDAFLATIGAVTVPLALFGLGAAAGLIAEEIALKADIEWKQGSAWWEDEDGPAKEIARINKRLREAQVEGAIPASVAEQRQLLARAPKVAEKVKAQGPKATDRVRLSMKLNRRAAVVRWSSLILCAAGFTAVLMAANPSLRFS